MSDTASQESNRICDCGCGKRLWECPKDYAIIKEEREQSIRKLIEAQDLANNHVDPDYIKLCLRVLQSKIRHNRTGIDTYSKFGERLEIDLGLGFPLLTTKRVFWRGVVAELLWFLSGSTDTKILADKGVHIWDGNTTREALDKRGLHHYPVGEAGPIYSSQWRQFGSTEYDPDAIGVDQIAEVIKQIKEDPTSRRMIVTAWNPVDLPRMALPPCHIMYQFYVDDGELSCQMYQRSVDVGLGLPFNIASYALLTHMVAHVTGLRVGRLIMCLGDTHIYQNHLDGILEQIQRTPRVLPKLFIDRVTDNIDSITEQDIRLEGYNPHPRLTAEMPMAV